MADNRRITHEKVRRINLRNWLSLRILPILRIAPFCHQIPGHDPNCIYSLRLPKSLWQALKPQKLQVHHERTEFRLPENWVGAPSHKTGLRLSRSKVFELGCICRRFFTNSVFDEQVEHLYPVRAAYVVGSNDHLSNRVDHGECLMVNTDFSHMRTS
jgi:hypothetical protein